MTMTPPSSSANTVALVVIAIGVITGVAVGSIPSKAAFVTSVNRQPSWSKQKDDVNACYYSLAARAYDSDTSSFRRLKYQCRKQTASRLHMTSNGPGGVLEGFFSLFGKAASWSDTTTSLEEQRKDNSMSSESEQNKGKIGTVIRTAARANMGTKSLPGRPGYTTRKNSLPMIAVNKGGVLGDYNHYRTQALASTPDRAVNILTSDVMARVRGMKTYQGIQDGDLGENVLVDGLSYKFFEVGKRYRFSTKDSPGDNGVVVEITEPAEPCANLCNLEFINHKSLEPKQRIEKCQSFIEALGIDDGFRGWYAKVVGDGSIRPGDSVSLLTS